PEPGLQARGARAELSSAGEAPPRPARSQLRAVPTKRKRGGGEGRARCLARGGDPSPLLRGLPGPNTAAPRQSERRFPRELASPLESRAPPGSVPPSGPLHCSAVPASPGIRQARRDALCRLAKRGGRDPTVGTSRGRRASLRPGRKPARRAKTPREQRRARTPATGKHGSALRGSARAGRRRRPPWGCVRAGTGGLGRGGTEPPSGAPGRSRACGGRDFRDPGKAPASRPPTTCSAAAGRREAGAGVFGGAGGKGRGGECGLPEAAEDRSLKCGQVSMGGTNFYMPHENRNVSVLLSKVNSSTYHNAWHAVSVLYSSVEVKFKPMQLQYQNIYKDIKKQKVLNIMASKKERPKLETRGIDATIRDHLLPYGAGKSKLDTDPGKQDLLQMGKITG
ncbi:translation initiation factor IF-2-like, partial [Canis lupus familiaris]|uniref:translation initiation factor IF-2-like n=1 Tax=Canis lupus familiaris TaxID=9615 RepID=UPI0018F4C3D1